VRQEAGDRDAVVVLGINAYHGDASAALVVDGEVVAAAEEERFTRVKHQAGFPASAIRWCLASAGVSPRDIQHVGISRNPLVHLTRKMAWTIRGRPSLGSVRQRLGNQRRVLALRDALAEAIGTNPRLLRPRFHRVEHHRAHLASALFCSPFEDATCLSLDGMGDFVSSMWAHGSGNRFRIKGCVPFPESLGVYYTAFTQFLGLPAYGDEYKLMGLAAYGEPKFLPELRHVLRSGEDLSFQLNPAFFTHQQRGVDMTWSSGQPTLGPLWAPTMAEVFGPARDRGADVTDRDRDLAASVQARLEEVEFDFIRRLHDRVPSRRLVMAGGVALNCLVNGRIHEETPFEEVWIQPAANDAGTAVGASLWIWNQVLGHPRGWEMTHAYLGPAFTDAECCTALRAGGLAAKRFDDLDLSDHVAKRITDGAIVGWYQGRMEFGPRALGNRSIVCDARRREMKDLLNARIKHREPFRPFAPSVLAEVTGDWFQQDGPSPFMLKAYKVRPDRRHLIPTVTHADGTGRLQTVTRDANTRYYDLIAAFGRHTGVPVVLNTSFNENEPIVMQPSDAVECFKRTNMDVLVMGNRVVDRGTTR
jgi:carbamoyltransferase